MRRVTLLGSTGSVGRNAVDLIAQAPDGYEVVAVTGGRNVELLARQARALRAGLAVTAFEDAHPALRAALSGSGIETAAGPDALIEAARRGADWTLSAIVGAAGLAPGLAAVAGGGTLALANKESLVAAGPLLMRTAREAGARILPVDSEHSGVFQALLGERIETVERVTITASGGAFRDWPVERLARATPEEAAAHPNWDMGQRITIDSASMFNKAMELIETKEFFGIDAGRIEAVLHPESLVHALVTHVDGAIIAHVGSADMRHAIGYALHYPDRQPLPVERLDIARIGGLSFGPLDETRWPAIRLAREAMREGGLSGAVFNAAKEEALDAFIAREIAFPDMAALVEDVMARVTPPRTAVDAIDLDRVLEADHLAREGARAALTERRRRGRWTA